MMLQGKSRFAPHVHEFSGVPATDMSSAAAMQSSPAQLRAIMGKPKLVTDLSLDVAFETIVIPRLLSVHGRKVQTVVPLASAAAAVWHADADCVLRLASALLAPHAAQSDSYIDTLLEQGAGLDALYREVFEPAQLHLGKLWDEDLCDDFHLAVGLGRLQVEIMRVNAAVPFKHVHKPNHSVLLSSQRNEPHRVSVVMSSEVFHRDGWDVTSHIPDRDEPLGDLLKTQWFDILKLSESGSIRRDSRLASLRGTINSARAASMNRSLIIMVDGRIFAERPHIYRSVRADAMCYSVLDAAPIAERLLQLARIPTPSALS